MRYKYSVTHNSIDALSIIRYSCLCNALLEATMARGRPMIGTPEEAAERRRRLTAERVRRLRERRRAEKQRSPASEPAAASVTVPMPRTNEIYGMAGERLRYFVERIERFEKELGGLRTRNPALADAYTAERRCVQEDLRNTWGDVKKTGFDVEAIREVIRLRKIPSDQRTELEHVVGIYKKILGM